MSSSSPPVIQSRRPRPSTTVNCPSCNVKIEFSLPADPYTFDHYQVSCFSCLNVSSIPKPKPSQTNASPPRKAMFGKTGTDDEPLDLEYYTILGVSPKATPEEIKKAYRKEALRCHPDKCPDDPQAEAKFKLISEAYQVLSNPEKRSAYNMHGKNGMSEPMMDPGKFFKQQFGGDKFDDIIGEISICKDFSDAVTGKKDVDPKEREKVLNERISILSQKLVAKLSLYVDAFPLKSSDAPIGTTYELIENEAKNSFKTICVGESDSLKTESYGIELLHAIGYTYMLKSDQWTSLILTEEGDILKKAWGFGGRFMGAMKEKTHILGETVSTIRTAIDLQTKYNKLQTMEKERANPTEDESDLTQEQKEAKRKLEQEAATKGLEALWKGSKMEVEAVLREVCDKVLGDTNVKSEIRLRRATALRIVGEVYSTAKL